MSLRYPWYDSAWLARYVRAREILGRSDAEKLGEFERAIDPLRTRPDFTVLELRGVLTSQDIAEVLEVVRTLRNDELETHEAQHFGRSVVHDHPAITRIQATLVERVSEAVGEAVEPSYSFLSLYTDLGVCPVHMDAPEAKWTLDVCLRQSEPWPIHFSQIVPWPLDFQYRGSDWERHIKNDPRLHFSSFALEPGGALLFSGSSQWHYRDLHPGTSSPRFCDLVFFHFVPAGTKHYVDPETWATVFGAPELGPAPPRGRWLGPLRPIAARAHAKLRG